MIDYKKLTKKQKQLIYNDWLEKWNNGDHDCRLQSEGRCSFCYRFWELCNKLGMECPVKFS
jgi:hypothetical protein